MKCFAAVLAVLSFLAPIASAQWTQVSNPPESFQGIEFFLPGEDRLYAGSFNGKVYSSADHGDSWVEIADGLPLNDYTPVGAMIIVGDWFLMSRFASLEPDERNFRSQRNGSEWSTWEILPDQEETFTNYSVVGETIFAVRGSSTIHRSDDFGTSWSLVSAPSASPGWKIFAHEGRLFATEQITNSGAIYRSDDLGATWTEVGAALGSSYVTSEIFWQGRLLVGVYHGGGVGTLWSSTDFGDSWSQITPLPTTYNINGMAIAQDGRLAIGASSGFPASESIWLTGNLVAWEDYTGDLPQEAWPFNTLVAHDGWFFKTGGTATKYRAPEGSATGVGEAIGNADLLALTAHPNPFQPRTTLSFSVPKPGHVRLSIHDAAGRLVRTLVNESRAAGPQSVSWEGRDDSGHPVASGVYFYRMEAGGLVATERVVRAR